MKTTPRRVYCSATSTMTGEPCKKWAMNGRDVCRKHGGATPRGLASVHTKTGIRSKDLPTRMAARFEESLADDNLLALRSEIALVDARIQDLLKRVDKGESGRLWGEVKRVFEAFKEANRTHDTVTAMAALTALDSLITRGHADYATWHEIGGQLEQRRRLVESEGKRMKDMQQIIRSDQFMLTMTYIQDSLRRHVSDRRILEAIGRDITAAIATSMG